MVWHVHELAHSRAHPPSPTRPRARSCAPRRPLAMGVGPGARAGRRDSPCPSVPRVPWCPGSARGPWRAACVPSCPGSAAGVGVTPGFPACSRAGQREQGGLARACARGLLQLHPPRPDCSRCAKPHMCTGLWLSACAALHHLAHVSLCKLCTNPLGSPCTNTLCNPCAKASPCNTSTAPPNPSPFSSCTSSRLCSPCTEPPRAILAPSPRETCATPLAHTPCTNSRPCCTSAETPSSCEPCTPLGPLARSPAVRCLQGGPVQRRAKCRSVQGPCTGRGRVPVPLIHG